MKTKILNLILLQLIFLTSIKAAPVKVVGKVFSETIEAAAKKSGRILTPVAREAAEQTLKTAVSKYGDDLLRVVRSGGLEALEQGTKHGDDFWKLCSKASPTAVRSLALNADELLPIAKRIGTDFVTLEGRVPGLGMEIVKLYGDDAAKQFKNIPTEDISKLVGYAKKADSPETVKKLYQSYQQTGGKILKNLDWKLVMAGGLSIAAIDMAHQVGDGVQTGFVTTAEKSPEAFADTISLVTSPIRYGMTLLLLMGLAFLIFKFKLWRFLKLKKDDIKKQ